MSVVLMSKRELNRLDVLARLDGDKLSVAVAAGLMNITARQTYRLFGRYRDGGASAIADQRRGRPSNNRLSDTVRDHAIALVREFYPDFGPTLAAEKLRNVTIFGFRERHCGTGCVGPGSGSQGPNASGSSNPGIVASISVSWSRSTARSTAGLRIVQLPARCSCSSTMQPAN